MGSTHPRRSRTPSDDQLLLPFSAPEPLRVALRSIDRRVAGVKSESRMRECRELAFAIWACGANDGCRAHVRQLIAVANQNGDPKKPVIKNRRHFFRVMATLHDIGLVVSDPNWDQNRDGAYGRAPSERELNEGRVIELVALTRESRRSKKCHLRDTHRSPTGHPPSPI